VTGYTFTPAKLSPGGDLGAQLTGKTTLQLAAQCNNSTECKGFTSSGWLKSSIKVQALWANWSATAAAGPCDGMFVKVGASPDGKRSYPRALIHVCVLVASLPTAQHAWHARPPFLATWAV